MRFLTFSSIMLIFLTLYNGTYAVDVFNAKNPDSIIKRLVIYSSLDADFVGDIITGYQQIHPEIEVEYHDLQSSDIFEKVINESDESGATADFIFSSAMDLQMKLANDGYAMKVSSLAGSVLPAYAKWRQMVFGLTNEPAVIIYNKQWFDRKTPPQSHEDLTRFIDKNSHQIYNKVATYDIERSGLGMFFIAQDQQYNKNIWQLINAMGSAGVRLYSSSSAILQRVADGRFILGYNILGSYAKTYAKANPDIGIIEPKDYTITMSRLALVPRFAKQPELGTSFLQFLASETGQKLLKQQINMLSLEETRGSSKYRHIRIGPGLVVFQDQLKRQKLIRKWNEMLNQK